MKQEVMLNPNARFYIHGKYYKIDNEAPKEGDLILDLRDGTFGVHDGSPSEGFVNLKGTFSTELRIPEKDIRKLVLETDNEKG